MGLLFKEKQTSRLSGSEPPQTRVAYDLNEPLPPQGRGSNGNRRRASRRLKALIDGILKEAAPCPPVRIQLTLEQNVTSDMLPLFGVSRHEGIRAERRQDTVPNRN